MASLRIKHRGLQELFEKGRSARIGPAYRRNATLIMDYLDKIKNLADCSGVKDFHPLKGERSGQYTMHVSGNYVITFDWVGTDITILDFEDYH
jgi:proteic killer suppression protein